MHKRAVGAVALLVVVVIATLAILVRQQGATPVPEPSPTAPTSRTMLVQVRDPSLLALGSVLMGVEDRLDQLWWTPEWWVDQIGQEEVSAAELGRKPVPYVMQTIQNQVQVAVDDAWVLDRLAFAGLVDAVGGVRLNIPRPTVYLTDQGSPAALVVGVQTLSGAEAADYVLDASLRDEQVRLVRFQAVWDQILRRFPTDPEKARALVVSLGALSKVTMPTEELADMMSDARDLRVTGAYEQAQVMLEDENGIQVRPPQAVRRAYALDARVTSGRMRAVFRDFPPPPDPVARVQAVEVRAEAVTTVRAQLLTRSWQSVWGGRTITSTTQAAVAPDVAAAQAVGLQQALGVTLVTEPLALAQAQVEVAAEGPLGVSIESQEAP
jgi:hypothetical protein